MDLNQALPSLLHLSYAVLDAIREGNRRVRSRLDNIDLIRQVPDWIRDELIDLLSLVDGQEGLGPLL